MQCPSCGARYKKRTLKCPECGAFRNKNSAAPSIEPDIEQPIAVAPVSMANKPKQTPRPKQTPSLIEFPGAKSSIPQWRKELGERVREVQERRAREAILEAGEISPEEGENGHRPTTGPLELIPQADLPPVNPLVAAALQRIERANGNAAVATAVDYERQLQFAPVGSLGVRNTSDIAAEETMPNGSPSRERIHNLAVVPTPAPRVKMPEPKVEMAVPRRKPTRLIKENDPALNYLDSIPTALRVDQIQCQPAPMAYRLLGSIVDLALVCLLASPLLALVRLTDLPWQDLRVIGFIAGTVLVVGFLYLTISTAFTGRTLGMKLFSLRVVDARTGLIPTGKQSAGRALVYLLSFASAGIAFAYAFFDSEKHTAHDRFTRTAVIRV